VLTADPGLVRAASGVVLPGVGHFGACMAALRAARLDDVAVDAAASGRPFLGICIGMQMLFDGSDESPDVSGLGVISGRVTRLPTTVRLPQMGWNTLEVVVGSRLGADLPEPAWLYFVHSYAPAPDDASVVAAWCDYGRRFAAAVEQGPVWATQFHPEKSGAVGMRMLSNFVDAVDRRVKV
jgi:glutamine amidotransferase